MHKIVDVKLTSVFSPICQTLIYENTSLHSTQSEDELLGRCTELLIIRLDGTVIGFSTFEVINDIYIKINSLHFRGIVKDHSLGEFWLSRYLKRYLRRKTYMHFLIAR